MRQQSVYVRFLGTGCDFSHPERESVCILVERGEDRILLDCCPGILRQLQAVNRDPIEVDTVALTHMHVGHSLGIPLLVFGNVPKGRVRPLRLIAPRGTKDKILQIIEWTVGGIGGEGLVRIPDRPFPIEVLEVDTERESRLELGDDIVLRAAPTEHSVPSVGFCLEFGDQGMKIAYSGDTQPSNRFVELARDVDLMIHEAFFEAEAAAWAHAREHSTAKEAGEIAQQANARMLALVHMHWTRYGRKDIAETMIADARGTFQGRVLVPEDLESIDLLSYVTEPFAFSDL